MILKAAGTTDTINACDCCGRVDLKKTVRMIQVIDGEEVGEFGFFGETCAANAAGRPVRDIRAEAASADREARDQIERERRAEQAAVDQVWFDFLAENGNGTDTFEQIQSLGGLTAAREAFVRKSR